MSTASIAASSPLAAPSRDVPHWATDRVRFVHSSATRPALADVSIDVPAGRLTALLGPNGSGKSTLLSLLLGTARPHAGTVTLLGSAPSAWSRIELARMVGVVPQGEEFAFPLTVRALVEMGRYPHLGPWQRAGRADHAAVDAALARCDLTAMADRAVGTLSGGERQRARLARALVQIASTEHDGAPAPGAALVLDEPTAALDLAHEMAFFGLVRDLARAGTTVLLVTHNLNLAARYADRLVLLHAGRVAAAGAPTGVLTRDVLSRVYGWPVTLVHHHDAPQVVPLDPDDAAGG